MTTVYVLATGNVFHPRDDHLPVRQQQAAARMSRERAEALGLRECHWCRIRAAITRQQRERGTA